MAAAVDNAAPLNGESKSARKKAAKAAAAVNGTSQVAPAVPAAALKESSATADSDASHDHPYLRELQKQIRNITKKLTGTQKTDSVIAENPGVSLDQLVAQRKINTDQKAAALKKPQLQAQLAQLEEQQDHYRKFDAEYQQKFSKQRDELTEAHRKELEEIKTSSQQQATQLSATELRKKLLIFSQFLRAAAAKRTIEEDADSEESRAFEGALLLVYGGDEKAVDAAVSLIEGKSEQVPSIEGIPTPVSYAQVKQASIDHAPFQNEEAWVDSVAEATGGEAAEVATGVNGSDPTITNAGLAELGQSNGESFAPSNNVTNGDQTASPAVGDATGNVAGERWDTNAAGGMDQGNLEESYEIIPRPADEVNVPADPAAVASQQPQGLNWADEAPVADSTTGNQAGEAWDTKAAGDQTDNSFPAEPVTQSSAAPADDGFHEVPGRHSRGRGGHRGRGGDGEFRGRGGRRGNFRGRGDGESRGGRGGGFRGRGRGGPRGGADAARGGS